MNLLFGFVFIILLAISSEGKHVQFNGYPEENRNVKGPFARKLFEGDILVPRGVLKATSRKRGATVTATWPNGIIPYSLDSSFSDDEKELIKSAMRDWEHGTCLSFVPVTSENAYLKITGTAGFGCFAFPGYRDVSSFPPSYLPFGILMNLQRDTCLNGGRIVRHELGHVIGFWHEQARPDRDNYVRIFPENIQSGAQNQFEIKAGLINSFGIRYDLKSVMHYGPKAFSKNNKNTIEAIYPNETLTVNENISVLDKQQVNKLYNCKRHPTATKWSDLLNVEQ